MVDGLKVVRYDSLMKIFLTKGMYKSKFSHRDKHHPGIRTAEKIGSMQNRIILAGYGLGITIPPPKKKIKKIPRRSEGWGS
jgi:hypothetical protein